MKRFDAVFYSLEVIEERIREKLTVEKLAGSVHFSKYHYQRLFREAVGESVMQYVSRRRTALAAQELAGTDASVLEIALKYGYDSHEGFTRSFRAHMGVTPAEYRKYHSSMEVSQAQKAAPLTRDGCKVVERRGIMMYSRNTDEILRELNRLIVQVRETVALTERNKADAGAECYEEFWSYMAGRAEAAADILAEVLGRVSGISRQPDEISFRFMIVKAIEDAAFQLQLTAFQIGLTTSRAREEHCRAFEALCKRYEELAQSAGLRSDRIVGLLGELAELIFEDMRKNALQYLQGAVESGRAAAERLAADPALPYGYIARELKTLADELAAMPLGEVTVSSLEDYGIRLDIIAAAAALDGLRACGQEALQDGVKAFREQLDRAVEFFRGLPENVTQLCPEPGDGGAMKQSGAKKYSDIAFQGNILLFYLRGELQKLEPHLMPEQRSALEEICDRLAEAIGGIVRRAEEEAANRGLESLREICRDMTALAKGLGQYGAPVYFIAKQMEDMLQAY